jgi:small subunit ribosomal protein S9
VKQKAVKKAKPVAKARSATPAPKKEVQETEVVSYVGTENGKYVEAVGRRKTSIARVRIDSKGEKHIEINKKTAERYFSTKELQRIVHSPFDLMNISGAFHVVSIVTGGGIHSQAEAVRHGIARALVTMNPDFRKRLKKAGFLTRDPRMRERKKFGLKRARKSPQWSKR